MYITYFNYYNFLPQFLSFIYFFSSIFMPAVYLFYKKYLLPIALPKLELSQIDETCCFLYFSIRLL